MCRALFIAEQRLVTPLFCNTNISIGMDARNLVSVCIIARNEEAMLPECLASVKDIASEIIVVDTGSTDATASIAAGYGARVISAPWRDDFSYARNVAIDHATSEWILCIDADERCTNPELLREVLLQAEPDEYGFLVDVRSNSTSESGTSQYVSQLLRVFRNDPRIRYYGIIHEQVIECFTPNGLRFSASPVELIHLGYDLPADQMHAKQLRNLELLDRAVQSNPHDAYILQQRAKTHLALNNLDAAEHDTRSALEYAQSSGVVRPQALNYGAVIAFHRGDLPLAIARAKESLQLVPHQAFALYILGEVYTAQADYAQAFSSYAEVQTAVERNDVTARIVGAFGIADDKLAYALGRSLIGLRRHEDAQMFFEIGFQDNPQSDDCLVGLANCAMHAGRMEEARTYLNMALQLAPQRSDIPDFLRQVDSLEAQHAVQNQESHSQDEVGQETPSPAPVPAAESPLQTTRMKPLVSLCMIVKNEEHTLRECLESVRNIVDQMVIVDTGSTDSTIAIAQEFGAVIGHFDWVGDFAAARNEALKLCTGEWIIYLDADERVSKETQPHLRQLISSLPLNVGAAMCTIVSPHRQQDDSTEMHRGGYPRIFRNYGYPKVEFRGRVHEQITPSILECGGEIVNTDVTIIHTGYDIDREQMEKKVQRNYELLIRHVQEEPLNAYAWFQLGQTLGRMNVSDKSEQALKFALELGTLSKPIAATTAATLAHLCGVQQRFAEALEWSEKSLQHVPNQAMALNYRAYSLLHLGRLDEAEAAFGELRTLLRTKELLPDTGYEVEISDKVIDDGLARIRELRQRAATA